MTAFSVRSCPEKRSADTTSFAVTSSMPSLSLRPILPFISTKLKLLRKRRSTHNRGSELLQDMLPARRPASSPSLPLSRKQSWNDGPNPMLDSATVIEMEAKNSRCPELDAEAPGPHILEIGTLEPVVRTQSQRSPTELELRNIHIPELERERSFGQHGRLLA